MPPDTTTAARTIRSDLDADERAIDPAYLDHHHRRCSPILPTVKIEDRDLDVIHAARMYIYDLDRAQRHPHGGVGDWVEKSLAELREAVAAHDATSAENSRILRISHREPCAVCDTLLTGRHGPMPIIGALPVDERVPFNLRRYRDEAAELDADGLPAGGAAWA